MHYAAHFVAGHDAAPSELTLPHMHFGAAYVGLGDLGDESSDGRFRNIVFVEFDLMRAWNESDFTFHRFRFIRRGKNVKREKSSPVQDLL